MTTEIDYAEMFDLKPEEKTLRILICANPTMKTHLAKVQFIDPALLLKSKFADQSFDLVLYPNILFMQDEPDLKNFIRKTLLELVRIGNEVRILPLVDQSGLPSPQLGGVLKTLQVEGIGTEVRQVLAAEHHLTAMLRLWHTTCQVRV